MNALAQTEANRPQGPFRTIPELFLHRLRSTPEGAAFLEPEGSSWRSLTWKEVGERVRAIAGGLRELGLQSEQRCALLSATRLEWILADLGTLCAGGATTTVYPSNTADDCVYILNDSESIFVFADTEEQVRKLSSRRSELGSVKKVIVFDGAPSADGWVMTLAELMARGEARHARDPDAYERTARGISGDALATLIYTSGTTGRPKGVELTQDCWVYEAEAMEALDVLRPDDVQYLWLPLSHVFGKVLEVAQLKLGFLTAIDGRVERLVENLGVVRPTFVGAVPRIFEKVHNRVVDAAKEGGALKYAVFKWAFGVGTEVSKLVRAGRTPGPWLARKHALATRLVFSKLQARFGGRLRFFVSGSAPLSPALAEFFHAAGLLVLEGYGLTESSAASCVNLPTHFRFGTVGPPLRGTEVRIASDGEVLLRSRGVMRGYHRLPEATRTALDEEGWLHTGDIGQVEDGFLKITDRKKDLFKTSAGKYIAPSELEMKVKLASPYVSQVLIHGNNRNFVSALIALDGEAVQHWAKTSGQEAASYRELVSSQEIFTLIDEQIRTVNAELPSYSAIKRFVILPEDLTLESGDLTPSLKLKRQKVEQKYRQILEDIYQDTLSRL
jgi:long-chain acyl-CoA synthetase